MLKIYALESTLTANVAMLQTLNKEIELLETEIAGLRTQIQGRAENELCTFLIQGTLLP